jgi:hypothetical protein
MRKAIMLICSATLILGTAGFAGAAPFTDIKYLGRWLSGTGHYTGEHDTPHDFVSPNIFHSGKTSGDLNKGSWWTSPDGWTGVGIEDVLANWNAGNPLIINPVDKDMKSSKLLSSIFILNFNTSNVTIPEPANLLMLGLGLIGVSFLGRRKFSPKIHRA